MLIDRPRLTPPSRNLPGSGFQTSNTHAPGKYPRDADTWTRSGRGWSEYCQGARAFAQGEKHHTQQGKAAAIPAGNTAGATGTASVSAS
eukprot:1833409-Prymnesium_polylepis.1